MVPAILTDEMQKAIASLSDTQLESMGLMKIYEPIEPPRIAIFPEVQCAASWWGKQLRGNPIQDNGDLMQTIWMNALAVPESPLKEEDVTRFARWLAYSIQLRVTRQQWPGESGRGWRPEEPNFGSANRVIHNDYGPDAILVIASRLSGVPGNLSNRFPIKTCMWINPGEVKVRCGYSAKEESIYPTLSSA